MFKDIGYAIRMINKNRGFAFAAIAVLAATIGANSLIFGITNAVLVRPLPSSDSQNLVWIWDNNQKRGLAEFPIAAPQIQDWKQQNTTLSGLAAIRDQSFD